MRLSNIALYDKNTTDFFDQGLGILSDAISSESTEEVQDNGNITYEMVLKYPIGGVLSDKLKLPNLIRAQESEDPNDFMIFEIYDYDEDDEGEMTVYAQAMPYRVLRLPFNDDSKFPTKYNNIQELMDYAVSRVTGFPSWFKITSDIIVANNLSFDAGNAQFENLGKFLDATLSLIDASVEYKWNRINILDSRGRDLSDIVLRDDKNTNGIKITGSYEKIINKVVPIIRNRNEKTGEFEDGTHMGSVVTSKDPFKWIPYYAGVTAEFDSQEEANNYISSNKLDNPAITVDVTPLMVDEDLTQVHTFDRITAYSTKLNYQDTLQVTTRVFDQLNAEVVSFKMGSIKKDINSTTSYTLSSLASEIARAQNIASGAARSADGKNKVYFPGSNPTDPSEGDLWFHKIDGKDVGEQYINGEWVTIIKDSMGEEIRSYVDQKMLENNDAMDKLNTDLKSNAQIIKDNKQAVDDAMDKVNEDLTKAKTDAESAFQKADDTVGKAQSAIEASGLATTTANAANDAATAAKQLATSTANSFATVQSQASTAADDAANAISAANKAQGDATSALGNSTTAISNAKDALNKINSMSIGGTNLATGTDQEYQMGYGIPTTTWENGYAYLKLPTNVINGEILPQYSHTFWYGMTQGITYTQTIWFETDATVKDLSAAGITWYSRAGHDEQPATLVNLGQNKYKIYSTYTWPGKSDNSVRLFDIEHLDSAFDLGTGTYLKFGKLKLEKGNQSTDWSPAPEDVQIQIDSINGELSQKVSQTSFDTLAQQVTDNTSQLKLTATAASLEVTSKKVDTLSQTVTDQGAKLDLTATSAQLKVTENKVDALNQTVSDNSAQLKLTATSAALETQSNRIDTISGQVDTNTAGITAANGEIELKANSSTVDDLSDTVKQQGIDLKAAQGELKLKLTQSDLTKGLDGYATQTWAQNQITATADGINSTLSSVQTQVQNSAVGTNLLIGTSSDLQTAPDAASSTWGGRLHLFTSDELRILAGNQVTVRAFIHNTTTHTVNLVMWTPDSGFGVGTGVPAGTDGYSTITSYSITSNTSAGDIDIRAYTENAAISGVQYKKLKLEKGSVATDWCPNPADNASATALSKLSQTVDGLSATFAKQTDLNKATSDFKVTADGLNLLTTATGTKGEKVTQVIADVNNIKTTMTGTNGYTTRLQTLEGFQTTATDNIKGLQNQQTTLAGQWTSTVTRLDNLSIGGTNLYTDTKNFDNLESWYESGSWTKTTDTYNGLAVMQANGPWNGLSQYIQVKKGDVLTYSVYAKNTSGTGTSSIYWVLGSQTEGSYSSAASNPSYNDVTITDSWQRVSGTTVATSDGYLRPRIERTNHHTNTLQIAGIKIEKGNLSTDWSPSPYDLATGTQINQLQDQIDLRTTVAGKVTAALNLSNDGGGTVTIRGASLYVTAASHFDAAAIQSAAIAGLAAEKITSGSISSDRLATTELNADNITSGSIAAERLATTELNADNITSGSINADLITTGTLSADRIWGGTLNGYLMDIVNINADNITTGTISGANLAINLTTGQVVFQSGRIHSTTDNIDINIDNGYVSVADSHNRVLLKDGQLQFVQPTVFDTQTTPYLSISNQGAGTNWAGATFVGRDSVTVANSSNVGYSILDYELGTQKFAGLSAGKNSAGNWFPTIVGGADRGIVLSGGAAFAHPTSGLDMSPFITIGTDASGYKKNGNRIVMVAQYVHSLSTYKHTTSGSANVIVNPDGALVRTSSASKYKSDIARFRSTEMAEKLIRLPQAHWYNKEDMKRYSEDPDHYSMPKIDYGMIAEDIAGAGLEDLVVRGDDGELEDVRYDHMAAVLLPLIASMKQEIEELKGE